jgi:E3 ubiquitin-protein ligase MGRN1
MGASPSRDEAPAARRGALGSRPAHGGSGPPPGYELAGAAAARVAGGPAGVPPALFAGRARDKPPVPVPQAAPVERQAIVTNVVNLKKSSLQLVQAPDDPDVYLVEFMFDAQVSGTITVYYCAARSLKQGGATEKTARVEKVSFTGMNGERPSKTRFAAGMSQRYRQKLDKGLDVRKYRGELVYTGPVNGMDRYPIVIRLEAIYPEDSPIPQHERVSAQMTFMTLTAPKSSGVYGSSLLHQDVLVDGTLYKLQELYGIASEVTASRPAAVEAEGNTSSAGDGEVAPSTGSAGDIDLGAGFTLDPTGNECVICLTEACEVAVRPCGHLCLCNDCADKLVSDSNFERRRCPICRSSVGNLLRIISRNMPEVRAASVEGSTAVAPAPAQPPSPPPDTEATAVGVSFDGIVTRSSTASQAADCNV